MTLHLEGTFRQGGLVLGRTDPSARVYFAGRELRVGPQGHFLLGFGRDAPERRYLVVVGGDGEVHSRWLPVESREYGTQRIQGLPGRLVTPKPGDLARIHREQARVRAARRHNSPARGFLADFRWPTKGRITGVYGTRRILNGEPRQPHFGIDIAAPKGTVVRAPAPAIVRLADPDLFFSGGTLILDHGYGLTSSFLHLAGFMVSERDRVEAGQPIGVVGATGRATGPHLDWRINWLDRRLNPALLVGPITEPK